MLLCLRRPSTSAGDAALSTAARWLKSRTSAAKRSRTTKALRKRSETREEKRFSASSIRTRFFRTDSLPFALDWVCFTSVFLFEYFGSLSEYFSVRILLFWH